MKRREFISLVGGATAAWPLAARAQQPAGRVWRIGWLATTRQVFPNSRAGFIQGMNQLGYVEGKDFLIAPVFAEGQYERMPDLAAQLVRERADVLLTGVTPGALSLQQATRTIPIVLVGLTDPVGNGVVASLARPGGNTTGLASSYDDSAPKQLELLAMVVPGASRIGLLWNPDNPASSSTLKITRDAAAKAGIALVVKDASNLQQIEAAFTAFARDRVPAVMVIADGFLYAQYELIARLAFSHRLPSMAPHREYTAAGGMLSYGQSVKELYRQAATYVHKLMRGAKSADLPVEQPTRFHLSINRKTADALGVTIPPVLYIFAEEVIE